MTESLRGRALRLLASREHSRLELKRKLASHAESGEELELLLDELEKARLLANDRYAEQRVTVRGGRYGNARLAGELRSQGVDDTTIANALAQAGDETERALAVWRKKFGSLPQDAQERAKQARFLAGRGFGSPTIRRVLQGTWDDE
ncbi:recombination regulator RecX [Azospira inquinata]|uniref:Regulatory protein RecX n=1 Tax=Azospira inquinata TaxID=2785627 RepID=A0A975XTH3_9RHOO|nr:recombination regulator RecX [Azospira inquinata]QWT46942.1 recombination regulator RecX [Azospira inquinata]QWT47734.1 recombination regulator RecX [Azospira inquinata]